MAQSIREAEIAHLQVILLQQEADPHSIMEVQHDLGLYTHHHHRMVAEADHQATMEVLLHQGVPVDQLGLADHLGVVQEDLHLAVDPHLVDQVQKEVINQ